MKAKRDLTADEFEAHVLAALREATEEARRLALVCRVNETMALALAEARTRESGKLLCELMQAENPERRPRARKGANGHR